LVRLALVEQPAGWMSDHRYVRIVKSTEDAVGDLLARLLLAVVDAGDDPVGLSEYVVGQVHAAFFQDVALNALEQGEAFGQRLAKAIDLLPLSEHPLGVEAAGHAHALRMVGDGDVRQAALAGRFDHSLDRSRR